MKKLILIMGLLLIAAPVMGASESPTPTAIPTVSPVPSATPSATPSVTPTAVGFHTPTPSATPTCSPVPQLIAPWAPDGSAVSLIANFTAFTTVAMTDHKFLETRTGAEFVVPTGHRLYISGISWSLQSAVIGTIEWDCAYRDVLIDYVYFPYSGQGKVMYLDPPITSLDPGISPVFTTDRACTGWLSINGVLR